MKTFLFLSLFPFLALAQALDVEMSGFNFSYEAPQGSGSADSFYRNMKSSNGQVEVRVEKILQTLQINVSGTENHQFLLKNAPSFVQEAETMSIEDMNLSFRDSLSFGLYYGDFTSTKDQIVLEDLQLDCHRERSHHELIDQVVSGCVKSLSLEASKFRSSEVSKIIEKVLTQKLKGSDIKINSLDLTSTNGNYKLSADVKAQISGTARSKGFMSYDAQKGVLTIKISEFKFGILNVKGMVFDELRKQEGDGLKVSEPYVHLTVKKSAFAPNR